MASYTTLTYYVENAIYVSHLQKIPIFVGRRPRYELGMLLTSTLSEQQYMQGVFEGQHPSFTSCVPGKLRHRAELCHSLHKAACDSCSQLYNPALLARLV